MTNNFKVGLLKSDDGIFVSSYGSIVSLDGTFSFQLHVYVNIPTNIYYSYFKVDNQFLVSFSDILADILLSFFFSV